MTKLIDLAHRKEATDLLVDCSNIAVWYGFPQASRQVIDWMKHRSDNASPVMWIDALRSMRFENFDEAKTILRGLLEQDPQDNYAKALFVSVLVASGELDAGATAAESTVDQLIGLSEQGSSRHARTRLTKSKAGNQTPAFGAVIG